MNFLFLLTFYFFSTKFIIASLLIILSVYVGFLFPPVDIVRQKTSVEIYH